MIPILSFAVGVRAFHYLRTWNEGTRCLELAVEALHIIFVVVGTLAVVGVIVVTAASGEIGCRRMIGAGQRSISHTITIQIFVAGESAELRRILPC